MAKEKTEIEFQNTKKVEFLDYVKKKRRWAFLWGFVVAVVLSCLIAAIASFEEGYPMAQKQIASVNIDGVIMDDDYRHEMLQEIKEREDVRALIVNINSPGGMIYPSEQLYHDLSKIKQRIPIVVVMKDTAASGGYVTAIASDHIIAGETTVTGSIGVISEIPNVSELLGNLGVETTLVRSSNAKGGISPLREPTAEEIADQKALIDAHYQWFRDLVSERRGLTGNRLALVSDGQVFTGGQALELGLIDEIGADEEALSYLEAQDEELKDLDIVDWEPLYPQVYGGQYVNALAESAKAKILQSAMEAQQLRVQALWR